MQPYYEDAKAGIVIYHGDCREVLPSIPSVDSILTDPPYGLGTKWQGGTWFTRGVYNGAVAWDGEAPHDVVAQLLTVGVPTILWGGNYFVVPPSRCYLAWDKTNSVPTMADFELAWTNIDAPAKRYSAPCNGWPRVHPTEKPIGLIRWCVELLPEGTVLDPFAGSCTTARAAKDLGRKCICIELEERYCEAGANRLRQEVLF